MAYLLQLIHYFVHLLGFLLPQNSSKCSPSTGNASIDTFLPWMKVNRVFFKIWLCNKHYILMLHIIAYNCIFNTVGKKDKLQNPLSCRQRMKPLFHCKSLFVMTDSWNVFSPTERADAFGMDQIFIMPQIRNANVSLLSLLLLPWN